MSLTREELTLTVAEASRALGGARIDRITQLQQTTLTIEGYRPDGAATLLVSVASGKTRLHLVPGKPRSGLAPGPFVMLLRKHLEGARLLSVDLMGADRVVQLRARRGDLDHRLVCELIGRHGNIFLLDSSGTIVGSLRPNLSNRRDLRVGQEYAEPLPRPLPARTIRFGPTEPGREVQALYEAAEREEASARIRAEVLRVLRAERKRLERRRQAITGDKSRAADADRYRKLGELILTNLRSITRGQTQASLTDYTVHPPTQVVVALDPAQSPKENAERYFRRYRKYRDAEKHHATQEARLARDLGALEVWESRLEEAVDDSSSLEAIRDSLVKRGLLRRKEGRRSPEPRREPAATPYRKFESRDGHTILVGRGGKENHQLTFRVARGNDMWLHTRDYPGAHVVVPVGRGEEIGEQTLLDAATLAAHFSRAKGEGVVDVSVTRRKHVHHPKGAPPGRVALSESKTLSVRLEPDRVQRLLARGGLSDD